MSVDYRTDCALASSWETEGDGVKMLTFCHIHPEFRWYSEGWPTATQEAEKLAEHREQIMLTLFCPECRAGKHGNCNGSSWDPTRDGPIDCPCNHEG